LRSADGWLFCRFIESDPRISGRQELGYASNVDSMRGKCRTRDKGFGPSRTVGDNATAEGRANNIVVKPNA
jgi:hypothetical protein